MSYPFVVGRAVVAALGERALHEIGRNIWCVDCQTCGQPLDGQRPALAVDDLGVALSAALHHRACRSSEITTTAVVSPAGPFLTYSVAAAEVMVERDDGTISELPLLIVNPSLEQVFLDRDEAGQWVCSTVTPLGWCARNAQAAAATTPSVRGGAITSTCTTRTVRHSTSARSAAAIPAPATTANAENDLPS